MPIDFLARYEALTPANLTLRERARLEENPNDLRWRAIFPRVDAPSVRLAEITSTDFRPAGGRREWNAQGREIPERVPPLREARMIPINPTRHLDEERLQLIRERADNEQGPIARAIVRTVDEWATELANAVDIQIERDAFEAWTQNQITVKDTKSDKSVVVSAGIPEDRYVQSGETLDEAENAFDLFFHHVGEAARKIGGVGAVRARRTMLSKIVQAAPTMVAGIAGLRGTLADVQEFMRREGYGSITLIPDERTYDEFVDGGGETVETYYMPDGVLAFQPPSGVVGATHFAPVTRAYDYMAREQVGNVQGVTIFYSPKNDGKTLMVESQANALTLPDISRTYVVSGLMEET